MRILAAASILVALLCAAEPQRGRKADVEVLETKARRADGEIFIDIRVKTADKTLRGLIVYFDLLSPENGVVTSQKAVLDEDQVQPGQERSAQSAAAEHVRAVRYKIRAFDMQERELRISNAGPFPIE
jgi:hypothetical protein